MIVLGRVVRWLSHVSSAAMASAKDALVAVLDHQDRSHISSSTWRL